MDKKASATLQIGHYLVLSSMLERHINSCLEYFLFDRPVFDSIEKESFDFKCKRLRNYLKFMDSCGQLHQDPLPLYEELGALEVEFIPIRRMRNFLAHAVLEEEHVVSTRRFKGENNARMNMLYSELDQEVEELKKVVRRSASFFHRLELILQSWKKKEASEEAP